MRKMALVVQGTSLQRTGVHFQALIGSSQPLITPAPENLMPSGFCRHAHRYSTHKLMQEHVHTYTHTHTQSILKRKKEELVAQALPSLFPTQKY